jgi:hypothetical protein
MAEKSSGKKLFEEMFAKFEKRQDERFEVLEERIVDQFHVISEGLIDQIKLLAEGHGGIIEALGQMREEDERQHLETRALLKLSFSQLDRRISDLESQVKDLQEWRKQIERRLQT